MGTHPIFESDFDCLTDFSDLIPTSWVVVPPDVTDIARTNPTLNPGSAVVCPTRRSAFTIWALRRRRCSTSRTTSSWSPTSWSSFPPKPSRLPNLRQQIHDQEPRKRSFPSPYASPSLPRRPNQQDVVVRRCR